MKKPRTRKPLTDEQERKRRKRVAHQVCTCGHSGAEHLDEKACHIFGCGCRMFLKATPPKKSKPDDPPFHSWSQVMHNPSKQMIGEK